MTDTNPPDNNPSPGDIAAEFRELGKSLTDMLKNAWTSQERQKLQKEIEAGLAELSATLNQAATQFRESPAGKNFKAELEDLRKRVESGKVEAQVREEVLTALRAANAELKKVASRPPFAHPGSDDTDKAGS